MDTKNKPDLMIPSEIDDELSPGEVEHLDTEGALALSPSAPGLDTALAMLTSLGMSMRLLPEPVIDREPVNCPPSALPGTGATNGRIRARDGPFTLRRKA